MYYILLYTIYYNILCILNIIYTLYNIIYIYIVYKYINYILKYIIYSKYIIIICRYNLYIYLFDYLTLNSSLFHPALYLYVFYMIPGQYKMLFKKKPYLS